MSDIIMPTKSVFFNFYRSGVGGAARWQQTLGVHACPPLTLRPDTNEEFWDVHALIWAQTNYVCMIDTMIFFYFLSFPCTSLSTIDVSVPTASFQSPSLLSSGTWCHVVCSWVLGWIILMGEKQTEHMFKVFKNISMDGPRVLCSVIRYRTPHHILFRWSNREERDGRVI